MRTMLTAVPTVILTALLGAGCGGDGEMSDGQGVEPLRTTAQPSPTDASAKNQENRMDVTITIGDQTFAATLQDTPATQDLLAQLPVTVEMVDHGGVEKTGPLPGPLSLEGQPEGADPDVGDVGYYAPGKQLVLYYGDQSYFSGIVILGRMEADSAERIADVDGSVTARVEAR